MGSDFDSSTWKIHERTTREAGGSCRRGPRRAAGLRHPLARTQLFELRTGLGGPTPPRPHGAAPGATRPVSGIVAHEESRLSGPEVALHRLPGGGDLRL